MECRFCTYYWHCKEDGHLNNVGVCPGYRYFLFKSKNEDIKRVGDTHAQTVKAKGQNQ